MKWEKCGLIWGPDGNSPWAKSHATVPTPVTLRSGEIRVYAGLLDKDGVGRVGYVDLDASDPKRILRVSKNPVLDIGAPGTFDDNGVLPSCFVKDGNKLYMFYNGFQLGVKIRYTIFSGLAVSEDGGETFQRVSRVAVLDRTDEERTFRAAPFVIKEDGKWKIWYPAGSNWVNVANKDVPEVRMMYAESSDGVHWPAHGQLCINFKNDDEHGVGRPWILKEGGLYKMTYSIRIKSRPGYSGLGYAESFDGVKWTRKDDEIGLDVGHEGGFDDEMVRYGVLHQVGDKKYMFYNGNNFGASGFGYAILAQS